MNAMEPIKRPRGMSHNWADGAYGVTDVTPTTIIEDGSARIHVPENIVLLGTYLIAARTEGPLAITDLETPRAQRALAKDLTAAAPLHAHKSGVIDLLTGDVEAATQSLSAMNNYGDGSPRRYMILTGAERLVEERYKDVSKTLGAMLLNATPQNRSSDFIIAIGSGATLPHQEKFASTQSVA